MRTFFKFVKIQYLVLFTFLLTKNTLETTAFQLPTPVVDTIIGAAAGGIGAFTVYPIDFVKTQLQTESGRKKYPGGFLSLPKIINDEGGFFGLYRGVWVQIIGVAPEKAIKLSVNDIARGVLVSGGLPIPPILGEILSGAVAGACQVVITNPLEVTKVALQTSEMPFKEVWKEIGGFKGLYKGADACLLRDISFSLILFPLYSHSKEAIPELLGNNIPIPIVLFLSGALAAAPAAYMTTPFDIIKTRQQSLSEQKPKQNINKPITQADSREFSSNREMKFERDSIVTDAYSEIELEEEFANTVTATITKPKITFIQAQDDIAYDNESQSSNDYSEQSKNSRDMNAITVGKKLISDGDPTIFFSGGLERVARSSPQFGVTLALFDTFKHFAITHGILQSHM